MSNPLGYYPTQPGEAGVVNKAWPWGHVRRYGAKGDAGITNFDGVMASGSPNLSSAAGGFVAADVGKLISVGNAGAPVAGTGTVSAAAGLATFTTSQDNLLGESTTITVGGTAYVCTAWNYAMTTCTLSGAPTFGGGAFFIAKTLLTTIIAYTSGTSVTLAANAGTAASAAMVNWGTNDKVAIQAALTYCGDQNSRQGLVPQFDLGFGNYKVDGALTFTANLARATLVGQGKYNAVIHYQGVTASCLALAGGVYSNLNCRDFSIYGDASSGVALDLSADSDFNYNATFERMQLFGGKQAFLCTRLFSSKLDTVYAESVLAHIFQAHCGPGTSWINTYAGRCPARKAGYRLSGTIRMYACNGVNSGGTWGIFGNNPTGTDGFQNDFPGIGIAYPDIHLDSCNFEAFTYHALRITQSYQQCRISGGTFIRTLAGNYHSVIYTTLQPLGTNGYLELDGCRAIITGGVATASNIYGETITPLLLKNDSTSFAGSYSVSAGGLLYPAIRESIVANTFNEYAKFISSLTARRFSVDMMRFNDSTLAAGTTTFDATGKTLVRTANTGATTLSFATLTMTPGAAADAARNGFLIICVEDSFTTIAHHAGSAYEFNLLGERNYLAAKGDVLLFALSEYDDGTLHRGWVQIGATRSATFRDSFTQNYSASITIDNARGKQAIISPSNATAFTINAPTNSVQDRELWITILNASGGAIGAITLNAIFHTAGALVAPANGFQRTYAFKFNGTSYEEMFRSAADVPN